MSNYLKDLKKKSGTERIRQLMEEQTKPSFQKEEDDGFWQPTVDESGTGSAVIRFLPPPEGEDYPFVKLWYYSFKGPGGWYINDSRTNISPNEKDPMRELNYERKNSGLESDKELAKKQCAKQKFISNIYVVKDEKNPQNEGKVFLYQYGRKIFDKLMAAANPEFVDDDEPAISPFCFWEGADFKLKIRKVDGQRNYDLSSFARPSVFLDDDEEKLTEVAKQCKPLQAFLDPTRFKTYDELKKRLDRVLALPTTSGETQMAMETPRVPQRQIEAPAASVMPQTETVTLDMEDEDLEAELAKFRALAKK